MLGRRSAGLTFGTWWGATASPAEVKNFRLISDFNKRGAVVDQRLGFVTELVRDDDPGGFVTRKRPETPRLVWTLDMGRGLFGC